MDLPLFSFFPALPPPVEVPLVESSLHDCPYLPGRVAKTRALWTQHLPPRVYRHFMDRAFRRSGTVLYQPVCPRCRACQPIRLRVDTFRPTRSQRRCRARNQDLLIACDRPTPTDEKFELYERYIAKRHRSDAPQETTTSNEAADGEANSPANDAGASRASFESFLYESPTATLEFTYREPASRRLLAVGLIDDCSPDAWSSVYFYFDPAEARRGLGTFGILTEIAAAAVRRIAHYYLGYWVGGSKTMEYKASFGPYELLDGAGVWQKPAG